mgnify:CR=1 FL=1
MLTLLQAMPGDYSLIFCLFYSIEQELVNANIPEGNILIRNLNL